MGGLTRLCSLLVSRCPFCSWWCATLPPYLVVYMWHFFVRPFCTLHTQHCRICEYKEGEERGWEAMWEAL